MKKKKRLLWQLIPPYLLIILFSLVAVMLYATSSLKGFYLDQIADDLRARAHLLEKNMLQMMKPVDADMIDTLCKEIGEASATRITIILPSGTVVGDSNNNPTEMDNHAMRPEIIEARKGLVGTASRYSTTLQRNMMYVAIPLIEDGKILAVIRTSLPITAIEKKLGSIQIKIVFGGLLIALMAAILSLYVSRRISRPIEKMKEGAEHFARGDLSYRLPETDLEEIGSLTDAMNRMAVQLDDRINMIIKQRNEIEAILSSMEEGVIAFDVDERIISANQATARIFNRKIDELENRTVQEAVRSPDVQQFVRDALTAEKNLENDVIIYQEKERIIHLHSTSLFSPSGHSSGILVVLNDVTQLRQLENMRRDFAANVSHEIKTPLTAIKGFVETLRHSCNEKPEDTERFIGIIDKHVNRLTAIVDDLISLSKIERGDEKEEIELKRSPVKSVIQTAVANCREKADRKKIETKVVCENDISAMINTTLLEQAIFNLLDNAINYSDRQSSITVSAVSSDAEVINQCEGSWIRQSQKNTMRDFLNVSTGWISPVTANRAEPRLGLAIVKHIAHAHGGRVSIDSEPGKGSTFSIYLRLN